MTDFINDSSPCSESNTAASKEGEVETASNKTVQLYVPVLPKKSDKDLKLPIKLDMLLDMPPASIVLQKKYGWNEYDKSSNIFLKTRDPLTLHRNPVPRSTDGIRGKTGVTEGLHVWEVYWKTEKRGTHAAIGVATKDAPLHTIGYHSLLGSNDQSWGWNLVRNKLNNGSNGRDGVTYPAWLKPNEKFLVPDKFLFVLDMDAGTLSFVVDGQYLGVAFTGLKGQKLFPMVSTVWGHCEITLKYIGGLNSGDPFLLKNVCRRVIRKHIGVHDMERRVRKLDLPKSLFAYLLYKDRI